MLKILSRKNRLMTETGRVKLPSFVYSLELTNVPKKSAWSKVKQSLLIESFLVNIPVPGVILYESGYEKYEIIDGKERIISLIKFYNNKLKLTELSYLWELNGFKYNNIDAKVRDLIDNRYIRTTMIIVDSSASLDEAESLKQLAINHYGNSSKLT